MGRSLAFFWLTEHGPRRCGTVPIAHRREREQRIAVQREVIVELEAEHRDTTDENLRLEALHNLQRAYVTIRERLRAELDNLRWTRE